MKGMKCWPARLAVFMLVLGCASCARPAPVETLAHGRFAQVRLYPAPAEDAAPAGFALVFSGADGWNADADRAARELSAAGALVAGVDMDALARASIADGEDCLYAAGDLENLARYVQAYRELPGYFPPVLAGVGSGAAWAYAMLAQSEPEQFAGALSLGYPQAWTPPEPLCAGGALPQDTAPTGGTQPLVPVHALPAPWVWLDGGGAPASPQALAQVQAAGARARRIALTTRKSVTLAAQFHALAAAHPPLGGSAALPGLPLIELPAKVPAESPLGRTPDAAATAGTIAILISGDGGWADLDREVGEALQARGVSVVGWDSLRYFWRARTPQGFAQDLERVIEHYRVRWHAQRVLLIGYSQGANVMPFGYNRLPAAVRAVIPRVILLGLGERAAFEFHVTAWLGKDDGMPVTPELQRMRTAHPLVRLLCVYGREEADSLCPQLDASLVEALELPGGHHFDVDYDQLAQRLIDTAEER